LFLNNFRIRSRYEEETYLFTIRTARHDEYNKEQKKMCWDIGQKWVVKKLQAGEFIDSPVTQELTLEQGMMTHSCNPSNSRIKQEDLESQASLGYITRPCLKK
jgi:hypothetical protein